MSASDIGSCRLKISVALWFSQHRCYIEIGLCALAAAQKSTSLSLGSGVSLIRKDIGIEEHNLTVFFFLASLIIYKWFKPPVTEY